MQIRYCLYAIFALAGLSGAASAGQASVEFVNPEKFTDVGRAYARNERDGYLASLKQHLVERAAKCLPADQKLAVWITDVDMAGSFEPHARTDEVRIVRDIYPPRIALRFRLEGAGGSVVKEGERKLSDLTFLMSANTRSSDVLRFEKALLDQWLRRDLREGCG